MNKNISEFQARVWKFYKTDGRTLPWRSPFVSEQKKTLDPYAILVSEFMLQQTQVSRVIPKYKAFLYRFPSLKDLANAPFDTVLAEWQGLGYNRRARYLHDAARSLVGHQREWSPELLSAQKGIGINTAAAVCVYAYNQPYVFIETNIRAVFLHHFFKDEIGVSDIALLPYVKKTLDYERPREWYWALMDYGSYLKRVQLNPNRRSAHYKKQSPFAGSDRELRAQVVRTILGYKKCTFSELENVHPDPRLRDVLDALRREGLISFEGAVYRIAK